jgi:PKD repeat protein
MRTLNLSRIQASVILLALISALGGWVSTHPPFNKYLWQWNPAGMTNPVLTPPPASNFTPLFIPKLTTAAAFGPNDILITKADLTGSNAFCRDGEYVSLPPIILAEQVIGSFKDEGGGSTASVKIRLRTADNAPFEYKLTTVNVVTTGADLVLKNTPTVEHVTSGGNNHYRFDIDLDVDAADINTLIITGLQVRANRASPASGAQTGNLFVGGASDTDKLQGIGTNTEVAKYESKAQVEEVILSTTNISVCQNGTLDPNAGSDQVSVTAATGTVKWYADAALTNQVGQGNIVGFCTNSSGSCTGVEGDNGSNSTDDLIELTNGEVSVPTTYTFYVIRENGGCFSTVKTVTITVNPKPDVFLTRNSASDQICSDGTIGYTATSPTANAYAFEISKTVGSGTFAFTNANAYGVVNSAAGTFVSSADAFTEGTYELRVRGTVNATTCSKLSSVQTFTVVDKPTTPNISAASAVTKGNSIPLTATNNGVSRDEERFEGEGVIQTGANTYEFNTTTLTEGNTYTVTYRYRVGDCWASNTKDITVQAAQPLFTNITNPNICEQQAAFTLNINAAKNELKATTPCASTGVTYSVSCSVPAMLSGSASTATNSYTFNPTAAPSAPQSVTLTVTATHTCAAGGTQVKSTFTTVNIFKALSLTIDPASLNPAGYCDNNNTNIPFTLKDGASVLTDKVIFVLNGVDIADGDPKLDNANRTFNPQELGAGTHEIKYKYTNVCSGESAPVTIKIASPANIDFKDITLNTYCNDVGNVLQLEPTINGTPVTKFQSTRGFFTFDGNPQPNGQNFIDLNGLTPGVYPITYVYRDGACSKTIGPRNLTIEAKPVLVLEGLATQYCRNDDPVTLTGKVTVGANPQSTVTLAKSTNDYVELKLLPAGVPFALDADELNPAALTAGNYEVTFVHKEAGTYLCESRITSSLVVYNPPAPSFNGIVNNQQFCQDLGVIALEPLVNNQPPALPGNGFFRVWQDAPSSFDKNIVGTGVNTITDLNGVGTYNITYNYVDNNTCSGVSKTVTFELLSAPQNLKVSTFKDENVAEIVYTASADGADPTWNWSWDFADGTTANTIVATKTLNTNANNALNTYTIEAFNGGGCVVSFNKSYIVNFDFTGLCQGSPTQFTDQSNSPSDNFTSWLWDFGDGNTSTAQNPAHTYANIGTYKVTLTVTTADGKGSYSLRRRVDIFPGVTVTPTSPYNEDFSGGTSGWIANGSVTVGGVAKDSTSWQLKTPAGIAGHIPSDQGNAWVTDNSNNPNKTDTIANYNANEQSYVESPCFNITTLNRPMVSFDYWIDTDLGDDGVVLLYTIDDGKTWFRVGEQNQGLDWYNSRPILGKPGNDFTIDNGDGQGWSGNEQATTKVWKKARFGLDGVLQRMDAAGVTTRLVRFRVAFGSNTDNNPKTKYDGFAFDNFQVTNRNRLVLMEYFINQAAPSAAALDAATHAYASSKAEAINIHYHTAFPGNDEINNQNPKDPSGRAFHYGIRAVPRPTLDGEVRDDSLGSYQGTWVDTAFAQRTLRAAPFLINIAQPVASNGTLTVSATVNAIVALDRKVVMHIAVIEDTVNIGGNNYYNAVRKMLPDAAGTYRAQFWTAGENQTLTETWDYSAVTGLSPQNLRVVVFIADYETNEIYQAEVSDVQVNRRGNGTNDQNQVTGVADDLKSDNWTLFPNPAADRLNVALPMRTLTEDIKWEVVNVSGQTVKQGSWVRGSRQWSLKVSDLAAGVYIIKLSNSRFASQRRFEKH